MAKELKKTNDESSENEYFYINEKAHNYNFSDYVKLNSSPRGIFLAFGQYNAEKKKFGIFEEVLLPFDVAEALSEIIKKHIKQLEDKKLIEKVDMEKQENVK